MYNHIISIAPTAPVQGMVQVKVNLFFAMCQAQQEPANLQLDTNSPQPAVDHDISSVPTATQPYIPPPKPFVADDIEPIVQTMISALEHQPRMVSTTGITMLTGQSTYQSWTSNTSMVLMANSSDGKRF